MKSRSFGCSVRQVSCRVRTLRCFLIALRALYGTDDAPVEESWEGVSETLKSPPPMRMPE